MALFSLIIPTRGRVDGLRRLLDSLRDNAQDPSSLEVIAVVDEDDRESQSFTYSGLQLERLVVPPGQSMGNLNLAGFRAASGQYLMLLNDDVVVHTSHWDVHLRQIFERYPDGIVLVHVNDLIFRDSLCTFPLLTREFCRLAGGICRPEYRRYRIDDHIHHIFDLIHLLGYTRRVFVPDVVFEHCNAIEHASGVREYVPNPAIQELDDADFEALLGERRRVALACVEHIEARGRSEVQAARVRMLESFPESIALRRHQPARWFPAVEAVHPASLAAAVIAPDAQTALGCLSALHAASKSLPVLVVPHRNDALALCRADYLALLDPAVRLSPGWVEGALGVMSSGAAIAVMKGALLIDMPACGHLRFDEPHEDVSEYVERARATGIRVADWPSGYARVLPPASPSWKPRIASSEPSAPQYFTVRLAFRLWTTLAEFRARWPFLGKLAMGIPAALFDPDWYRTRYPGVAASGVNPLLHYLYRGAFDDYDPNPHFHSAWYLANNPDVAASGLNPLLHFVRYGAREGRNPNVYFSTRWYIQQKPPLPVSSLNPLVHFITIGIRQGRSPMPGSALPRYLERLAPARPAAQASTAGQVPMSVVIPTRNRGDMLVRMLTACSRHAAGCELEFVVVDDGSSDGTPDLLRELAAGDPRLRWQSLPPGGPGRARNLAASLARYDVLLFMGDDILPADDRFFVTHATRHAENPESDFAVLGRVDWPEDEFPVTFTMSHTLEDGSQFAFSRLTPGGLASWQFFYTSNLSIKKSLVPDWMAGGFDTGFPGAALEDMELAYRFCQSNQGLRLHYEPASIGLHHHPYNLGGFLDRQFFVGRSLRRMLDLHPELLDEYGLRNVDAALRRPARRSDAEGLRSATRSIAAIKAAARVLEAQGLLGSEDWHGAFLSALFELCMHDGFASEWPPEIANLGAARSAMLGRFFSRLQGLPGAVKASLRRNAGFIDLPAPSN